MRFLCVFCRKTERPAFIELETLVRSSDMIYMARFYIFQNFFPSTYFLSLKLACSTLICTYAYTHTHTHTYIYIYIYINVYIYIYIYIIYKNRILRRKERWQTCLPRSKSGIVNFCRSWLLL